MKKLISLLFTFMFMIVLASCGNDVKLENYGVMHETEFGGVYIKIEIDDFNELGFEFGDSVDIEFTNGYKVNDIPYYNGYYVDAGETLLVGYPGYEYIRLGINYGNDYWVIAGLKDTDKANVYLKEKAKYKDIQETMNIQYKDERSYYESDAEFANYRMVNVGNIKSNILYRGASPCDNKHKRAAYVDELMEEDNINFIINLADTAEKIEGYIEKDDFNSQYFLSLYRRNLVLLGASPNEKVMPLAMNMNYKSDEFRGKVADGFKQMLSFNGPYYVHCQEGKDRTGFVIIVIEALMGATYQEIVDDYMLTYKNYYKITKESDELRYRIIKERNVDAMLKFLIGDENKELNGLDFVPYIKTYLINGGMTEAEVNELINKLSK
ncbi:MAG: tyrosine-protein phosphatase [Acholeplasmatales bacterium]|nr:tyrosine-protein phosphatase [Acholeplasmatales bacterium]